MQAILFAFTSAVWIAVGLLMLPAAHADQERASFMEAFFTATSAICVTGLTIVDTPTYWSPLGHVIILALIQIGGFGVMTLATVFGLTVLGKLSLRSRINAAHEVKADGLQRVSHVVGRVLLTSAVVEAAIMIPLTLRFWLGYDYPFLKAVWHGIFFAVSSFNNAGFSLYSDSLMSFATDPWICLPIMAAIVLGGLGFPVLAQLHRYGRNVRLWSMNTRIVIAMTVLLLVGGAIYITGLEWADPTTLGPMNIPEKLLAGSFTAVQTRTAGFNSIDVGAMHPATWLGMDILMFIGGGPAGTAGGIKVTTFAVLFFILLTEVRGESAVNIFGKRLSRAVHRQAISVVLLAMGLVVISTMTIVLLSPYRLEPVLFEVISAFATVGLSTGITANLDPISQTLLCFLMYLGRLGPITFASALALRPRKRLYELPKERPIIG